MIFGYVGAFGSGKTLNMVKDLMINMIFFNRRVYSNIPIQFVHEGKFYKADYCPNGKQFRRDILKQRNTDIAIDEAGIYFPNFLWNKLPENVLIQFHEQRKTGCNIYYTTQVNKHTVKRLRDLSFVISLCSVHHILPINIGFFFRKKWVRIEAPKLFFAKRFWPAYFEGNMDSAKKYERYYHGTRILYPSEAKRIFKAYKTDFIVDTSIMHVREHEEEEDKNAPHIILDTHI